MSKKIGMAHFVFVQNMLGSKSCKVPAISFATEFVTVFHTFFKWKVKNCRSEKLQDV